MVLVCMWFYGGGGGGGGGGRQIGLFTAPERGQNLTYLSWTATLTYMIGLVNIQHWLYLQSFVLKQFDRNSMTN